MNKRQSKKLKKKLYYKSYVNIKRKRYIEKNIDNIPKYYKSFDGHIFNNFYEYNNYLKS